MKSIAKKRKLYDNAIKQQQQEQQEQQKYELGDFVGIQIDYVNRINTSPKILPCKVIYVPSSSSSDDNMMYEVCTLKGVLSVLYDAEGLLDLRAFDFPDLHSVDPKTLPPMTFSEAIKEYVSEGSINPVVEACNCNGKCDTESILCKAKHVKCCARCHPKRKHTCANI